MLTTSRRQDEVSPSFDYGVSDPPLSVAFPAPTQSTIGVIPDLGPVK